MKIEIVDLNRPQLVDFSKVGTSSLGFITIAEALPFEIKRVYWTYYAPHEVIRGHHAHKATRQIIFAVSGNIKFEIESVDGIKSSFVLDSPQFGLYIPVLHWRTIQFSHNAVLLCIASEYFNEEDYIRDYSLFKELR